MTKTRAGLFAAWALAAAACGGSGAGPTEPAAPGGGSGGSATSQGDLAIVGRWRLVELVEAGKPAVSIGNPEAFTAEFSAEDRVSLRADCNRCAAAYSAQPSRLSVSLMACTLAACASAPLDTTFAGLVSSSTSWTATGDGLELRSSSGTLRLRR
jgi:heat shock protein HslJ